MVSACKTGPTGLLAIVFLSCTSGVHLQLIPEVDSRQASGAEVIGWGSQPISQAKHTTHLKGWSSWFQLARLVSLDWRNVYFSRTHVVSTCILSLSWIPGRLEDLK